MRQSILYHEMLSIVIVPLLQRPVLDVSAGLPFSLWAVPPEIRGLGCWMEARGSSFLLWMLSLIMNECDSGKCAPWTAEETSKSCRAPEGICLWQTTSPARGTDTADQWVPLIKRVKAWSYPPASWSFCPVSYFQSEGRKRSMRSAAAGNLSAYALSCMNYCLTLSRILCTKWWKRIFTAVLSSNISS